MMAVTYILLAHKLRTTRFYGGTEETTTGVKRLELLQSRKRLKYPVIAVNNAYTKHLFDNRYGTGQSTIDGILRTTGLFLSGKQCNSMRLRLGRKRCICQSKRDGSNCYHNRN